MWLAILWIGIITVTADGFLAAKSWIIHGGSLVHIGSAQYGHLPAIWVEEAEDDFVDEDENLEEGEVCLKAVKAFSSPPWSTTNNDDDSEPRFLCAGALVLRPPESQVCEAWTADSMLDEGSPNLQLQGALRVLDRLLLFHLERHCENTILGLQAFVVKCGNLDSEYSCASYMAAVARGFRPLRELVRVSSIYTASFYSNDLEGLVFNAGEGKTIYQRLAMTDVDSSWSMDDQKVASTICHLLPDDDTIRRCTHKRYISPSA